MLEFTTFSRMRTAQPLRSTSKGFILTTASAFGRSFKRAWLEKPPESARGGQDESFGSRPQGLRCPHSAESRKFEHFPVSSRLSLIRRPTTKNLYALAAALRVIALRSYVKPPRRVCAV